MTKTRLKQVLAVVFLGAMALGVITVTGRLGRIIEQAESGADATAAFTEVVVPVDPSEITWDQDASLPRLMEPGTRQAIGESYLISLALLDGSVTVPDDDLAVHLTGPALNAARVSTSSAAVLSRSHRIRVIFYSADGQLVELEDEATRIIALDRDTAFSRTERAVAVLVSIDGVWHLRHRVVEDANSELITSATTASTQ
jgi:hypothetical protein